MVGITRDDWRRDLPGLVARCCQQWNLVPGDAYPEGSAGHVVRVTDRAGSPFALKIILPHREAEHEVSALESWGGEGAVRVMARDDECWAVLLEHCDPGTHLSQAGAVTAMDVLTDLLPRLWKPAGPPFRPLTDEAESWISTMPADWERTGRRFEKRVLDAAIEMLGTLSSTQGEQVLVNQDLHGDNVLAAEREPWLVIDPKPLAGEREFSLAPIIRSFEFGHSRQEVLYRLDRLTAELGLDRERARGWAIGQTIAWAFDSDYSPTHVESARWLLQAR